jgi:hypothetical protein
MESQVVMRDNAAFVLLGIAGVASTFAGFAGVVATFGRRAEGQWLPEERFRLINMIVLSLVACLLSFVPLIEDCFTWPKSRCGRLTAYFSAYFARLMLSISCLNAGV